MKKIYFMLSIVLISISLLMTTVVGCTTTVAPQTTTAAPQTTAAAAETTEEKMNKPPYVTNFPWGEFSLNPKIASKIENNEPLNFVVSCLMMGSVGAQAQLKKGIDAAVIEMEEAYDVKINVRMVGPVAQDLQQQIALLEPLIQAGQVDSLAIWAADAHSFDYIVERLMNDGIPTFDLNTDSPESRRIAFFGAQDTPDGNGIQLAEFALDWAKKNDFTFKTLALTTGDETGAWAQGRMEAFSKTIKAAVPDLVIYGTPNQAAVNTGWVSADMYSKIKAFLIGHPDVNFVFNSDWGGPSAAQAIIDLGRVGEAYVACYNQDEKILGMIGEPNSPLIGTADQNYVAQGNACILGMSEFLFDGMIPENGYTYTPIQIISAENVDEMKVELGY